MKKLLAILIVVVAIGAVCFFAFSGGNTENSMNDETSNEIVNGDESSNQDGPKAFNVTSAEDLSVIVDELYAGNEDLFPSLMTQPIDVTDSETVSYMTGLENGNNLEFLVVSEPMMSSQAYSLILAKVKDGVDPNSVAKEMSDNINMRKWVCVSAEKLYATSSEDIVFLVMSSDEMALPVYSAFKSRAGNLGSEFEKIGEVPELPEDMY